MRGKDEKKRKIRGMTFKKTPAETDLYCPGCLSQVILYSFGIKNPKRKTFLCERCEKINIRKNVLSFDDMITEKFNRNKNQQLKRKQENETLPTSQKSNQKKRIV